MISPVRVAAPWLPLGLLLAAAGVGSFRVPILLALAVGLVVNLARSWISRRPADAAALTYGACLLVAFSIAWSGVTLPASARDGSTCASLAAPFATYRVAGAVLVLAATGLLVRLVRSTRAEIGLRLPSRAKSAAALGVLLTVGLLALFVGPAFAQPFFGPLPVSFADLRALLPALLFALANASMEETVYRGALLRWILRSRGPALAMSVQALAFGLAHGVSGDFVGSPLPVIAATAAAGLVFGAISLRTGSLLLPIALHAALDLPIYYANACLQA